MELNVLNVMGVIGFTVIYIWLKVWVYKREYDNEYKDTKDNKGV